MFLIAKIVRGRRLLHELEKEEHEAAIEAAQNIAATSRRALQHRRSSPTGFDEIHPVDESCSSSSATAVSKSEKRNMNRGPLSRAQSCRAPSRQSSTVRRRKAQRQSSKTVFKEEDEDNVKTVRQKTDGSAASVEEDAALAAEHSKLRRTSSMPSVCEAPVQPTAGPQIRHYDYDKKMNKLQKRALRFTWQRLQTRNGGKRVESVFEEVYDRLQKQLPAMRDMFTTRTFLSAMARSEVASLRDHARATVKMIDNVIKNLDCEKSKRTDTGTDIDPRFIGSAHASLRPYGFTGNYWEKLGETMIDVVLAQEAVRDLPGAGQAWVILIACLVDQLRVGFDANKNTTAPTKVNVVLHNATQHLHYADSTDSSEDPVAQASVLPAYSGIACPFAVAANSGRRPSRPESGRLEVRRTSEKAASAEQLAVQQSPNPSSSSAVFTESIIGSDPNLPVHKISLTTP